MPLTHASGRIGYVRGRLGAPLVSAGAGLSVSWILDFDAFDDVEASGNHEFMVSWFHLELERAEPREGVDLPIQGDEALHQRSAEHESWAAHPQFEPRAAVGFVRRVSAFDMAHAALVVGDERRAAVEARLDPRLELAAAARAVPGLEAFSDLGHVKRKSVSRTRSMGEVAPGRK